MEGDGELRKNIVSIQVVLKVYPSGRSMPFSRPLRARRGWLRRAGGCTESEFYNLLRVAPCGLSGMGVSLLPHSSKDNPRRLRTAPPSCAKGAIGADIRIPHE